MSRLLVRKEIVRGSLSIIIGLAIWELSTRLLLDNELLIPPPSSVLITFWNLASSGELNKHLVATLIEFICGFINDLAMQFQSDMLQVPVQRPQVVETTALGAAYLAGLAVGYWESQDQIAANWSLDRTYTPQMSVAHRDRLYRGWQEAVRRSRAWATEVST